MLCIFHAGTIAFSSASFSQNQLLIVVQNKGFQWRRMSCWLLLKLVCLECCIRAVRGLSNYYVREAQKVLKEEVKKRGKDVPPDTIYTPEPPTK
mmetsp:Transcript_6260/g.11762  ORF Transcript_6260/g.11762 Transcript_6260/m.11762 type:complete len:94 (-) Transcript_6260:256-537(-)